MGKFSDLSFVVVCAFLYAFVGSVMFFVGVWTWAVFFGVWALFLAVLSLRE